MFGPVKQPGALRVTRLQRLVAALAIAYPLALLVVAVAFPFIGERWWVTGLALYLPRLAFAAPLPILVGALIGCRLFMLLWTQVAAALLVIFPLMGFVVAMPAKARAGTPTLRVLSYNVDDAQISGSYDDVVAEIDRYSPDIACLVDAGDMIAPQLRARYPSVVVLNQFVVASRFTIASTTEPPSTFVEGRMHSPRFVRVALESPIGHLVTYCVHPISPREALYTARGIRGGILAGRAAAAFVKNSGLRERQVELFSEGALGEGDAPVIIAGDTNLPSSSFVLRHYLSSFQDGFVEAGWGFGFTFPTDKKLPPWMRIDRILASAALRFVRFQIGTSRASDHRCVVADVQRR
jgi:vancomycin resistance protein VanJ